jgi:glycosyltransferase involved in cell wall biosynthesis
MTEASPVVSILLPVRNEQRYLPAALDSLYRQTLTSWELVAVDDGSSDGTPAILAEAARRDPRVRVIRSGERGLVPALNLGLEACRSSLVARMDGDDISHFRRLEFQEAYLAGNPAIDLVACGFRHIPRTGLGAGMRAYEQWQNSLASHGEILRDLFVESPFVHPSVMFRRDTILSLGGYRDSGWPEDYDLWLRMAAAGIRFARLPQKLFFWRERPERATRTLPEYSAAAFRKCKLHHLKRCFLAGMSEVILAGAGREGRAWYRTLREEQVRVTRWVDVDPRKIGRVLHGAPVCDTDEVRAEKGLRMLVTVGTRGARDQIRDWAVSAGFREGEDFLCVT